MTAGAVAVPGTAGHAGAGAGMVSLRGCCAAKGCNSEWGQAHMRWCYQAGTMDKSNQAIAQIAGQ